MQEMINIPAKEKPTKPKEEYWQKVVEDWQRGNEGISAYCQRLGINIHTFNYWRSKFSGATKAKKAFVKLVSPPSVTEEKPIIIQLLSDVKIVVPTSISKDNLINVLEALGINNA